MTDTYAERWQRLIEQRRYERRAAVEGPAALIEPYVATEPRIPRQRVPASS